MLEISQKIYSYELGKSNLMSNFENHFQAMLNANEVSHVHKEYGACLDFLQRICRKKVFEINPYLIPTFEVDKYEDLGKMVIHLEVPNAQENSSQD